MVRFCWHVEDGLNALMPPGAFTHAKDSAVRHASCEIELQGSKEPLEAVFTLPPHYLQADKVRGTGVLLGHGASATEYKGRLLTELAVALASQGFLVLRYCCKHREQRRQRACEKALDAAATAPFARSVRQWVLAGLGSGARVAASVGGRVRSDVAGYVMLAYPLTEPVPQPTKSRRGDSDDLPPPPTSSDAPLLQLAAPALFLLGDADQFCSPGELREFAARMPAPDVRAELLKDANHEFRPGGGQLLRRLCACVLQFVAALDEGSLHACSLARAADLPPDVEDGAAQPMEIEAAAQGQAQQCDQ